MTEWAMPDRFVQVLTRDGGVFDVSVEQANLLLTELRGHVAERTLLQFEDVYGALCHVRADAVTSMRESSAEVEANYRSAHDGENWEHND